MILQQLPKEGTAIMVIADPRVGLPLSRMDSRYPAIVQADSHVVMSTFALLARSKC